MSPVRRRRRRGSLVRRHRRPVLIVVGGIGMIALLAAAWCMWRAHGAYEHLATARDEAVVLRESLERGDVAVAERAEGRLMEAAAHAREETQGPTWGLLEALPVVGDDAEALATVSSVLVDLTERGIGPLVDSAVAINAEAFAPERHQFPLGQILELEDPAATSSAAFNDAAERLEAIPSQRAFAPLRRALDALRDQVLFAADALDVGRRAAALMPSLLGVDEPRDYLFVLQNNAEVRATGGLLGSISLIHAEEGRVEITRQEAGGLLGEAAQPVLPLTAAEQTLYGDPLGTYFMDANFTPDFPRAAELMRARWRLETGMDVDGVFVIDPVAVSYLLRATGPIQVQERTLTAQNVIHEVEHLAYLRLGPAEQDAFFNAVAKAAFDAFADGRADSTSVLRGLARGVTERRILMHSFVAHEQRLLTSTTIAGGLPERGDVPVIGAYLNSGSASKLSYFLDYQVDVTSASCTDGRQVLIGRLQIRSAVPDGIERFPETVIGYGLAPSERGHQLVNIELFGPAGGTIEGLRFGDQDLVDATTTAYLGRPVLPISLPLAPGQTRVVTWRMSTGVGQTEPTRLYVTPGSQPENESSTAPTTC